MAAVSDPHGPDVAHLTLIVGDEGERFPVRAYGELAHQAAALAAADILAVSGVLRQLSVMHVEARTIDVVRNVATAPRLRESALAGG